MNPDTPRSGNAGDTHEDPADPVAASSVRDAALSDAVPGVDASASRGAARGGGPREPRKVVARLKEQTASQLTRQKQRAASALGSVVAAARDTSRQLRDEQRNAAASVVETAASQLDRLAGQLGNRDIDELADEARRFAREQPALFIGASLVAGFVATRFARSSSLERGWQDESRGPGRRRAAQTGGGSDARDAAAPRAWPGDTQDSGAPRGSF
jgi:hypothetical protein